MQQTGLALALGALLWPQSGWAAAAGDPAADVGNIPVVGDHSVTSETPKAALPPGPSEYEQHVLSVDQLLVLGSGVTVVSSYRAPTEGIYRRKVPASEFYKKLDRPELTERYQARRRTGLRLIVGGSIPIIGGLVLGLGVGLGLSYGTPAIIRGACQMTITSPPFSCTQYAVMPNPNYASAQNAALGMGVAGGVLGNIGLGVMIAGVVLLAQPHPLSESEMREAVDRYNRSLKAGLSLRDVRRAWQRSSVLPLLGPQLAGLSVVTPF
jgi:hypothetical protein